MDISTSSEKHENEAFLGYGESETWKLPVRYEAEYS